MRASGTFPGVPAGRGVLALCAALLVGAGAASADVRDPFPEIRPSNRAQAIDYLIPRPGPGSCTAERVEVLRPDRLERSPARARALALLQAHLTFEDERTWVGAEGWTLRYSVAAADPDRVDPADRDGDGVPDVVDAVRDGIHQAHALLVRHLELPLPDRLEVVLAGLRPGLDGYVLGSTRPDAPSGSLTLVLGTGRAGPDRARRAAIAGYAQALALTAGPRFPEGWSDALALWTVAGIDGLGDAVASTCLSPRIGRLAEGVVAGGDDLGRGNALWLSFLEEAYGVTAVRLTVEELAGGGSVTAALDRAVRRAAGEDLVAALREFHVWTVLVGSRADDHHFSFARQLADPHFASSSRGLPALSVQSDPPVAPTGSAQIALAPGSREGGLRILFEGELGGRWDVDLILLTGDGTKHRLALPLDEGRGEKTVPLAGLAEAWILVRNLGDAESTPRRYSYSAHHEQGFPFEMSELAATRHAETGVQIAWETGSEFDLFGFNIVRVRDDGGQPVIVNPMWVPALGEPSEATSYRFVDRSAEPGVAYRYSIQGITRDGLTSESDPVVVQPLDP